MAEKEQCDTSNLQSDEREGPTFGYGIWKQVVKMLQAKDFISGITAIPSLRTVVAMEYSSFAMKAGRIVIDASSLNVHISNPGYVTLKALSGDTVITTIVTTSFALRCAFPMLNFSGITSVTLTGNVDNVALNTLHTALDFTGVDTLTINGNLECCGLAYREFGSKLTLTRIVIQSTVVPLCLETKESWPSDVVIMVSEMSRPSNIISNVLRSWKLSLAGEYGSLSKTLETNTYPSQHGETKRVLMDILLRDDGQRFTGTLTLHCHAREAALAYLRILGGRITVTEIIGREHTLLRVLLQKRRKTIHVCVKVPIEHPSG